MTAAARGALHLPVNTLALRRGGLVKAVMMRANALAAADGARPVVIEVLAVQPRLADDVAELVERGFLDPRVHVRGILRCLDPLVAGPTRDDPVPGCVHHPDAGKPDEATRSSAGRLDPRLVVLDGPPEQRFKLQARVPTRDEAGRLRYADVVTVSGDRLRREEYGTGDRVVRILEYRPGDARPVVHRWLSPDGSCYLAVWQNPGSRDWANAFALVDSTVVALPNARAMYRVAVEHALRDEAHPVLFSEFRDPLPNLPGRGFDEVAKAVRHPTLRRVAVVHSNHARVGHRTLPLPSSPNFTALLSGLDEWDLLVTATEHQAREIGEQYGHRDRIRAIAHYGPEPITGPAPAADPDRFVLVARIHRKKRVDEAVEVFRLVVDGNPRAHLDVYGFGYGDGLEARVQALVDERGLRGHITFRGFVENPEDIYAGACATMQTSESEGFGMALLESLAQGVPVVAYDVSYGTDDAVRDGVDGFVVPWGDRQAMADRLLDLSRDPALRARLSAEAPAGAARFSRQRYVQEWTAALAALPEHADDALRVSVRVRARRAEFDFGPGAEGRVELRRRDRSESFETDLRNGAASPQLPESAAGNILDVFLRGTGDAVRVPFRGLGESDDPTWRVYATEHGYLSLKKLTPGEATAAADGAGRPEALEPVTRRALRRLRRAVRPG